MKFMPKEDIKGKGGHLYEAGNTYDSVKHGLDDATVERWYRHGWTEIEGRESAPERQVRGVVVRPDNATNKHRELSHG